MFCYTANSYQLIRCVLALYVLKCQCQLFARKRFLSGSLKFGWKPLGFEHTGRRVVFHAPDQCQSLPRAAARRTSRPTGIRRFVGIRFLGCVVTRTSNSAQAKHLARTEHSALDVSSPRHCAADRTKGRNGSGILPVQNVFYQNPNMVVKGYNDGRAPQSERSHVHQQWRDGHVQVVCATIAFGDHRTRPPWPALAVLCFGSQGEGGAPKAL